MHYLNPQESHIAITISYLQMRAFQHKMSGWFTQDLSIGKWWSPSLQSLCSWLHSCSANPRNPYVRGAEVSRKTKKRVKVLRTELRTQPSSFCPESCSLRLPFFCLIPPCWFFKPPFHLLRSQEKVLKLLILVRLLELCYTRSVRE